MRDSLWHEHICFKATVWLSDVRWESQGHSFDNVSVQLIQGIDHVHQDVIHFCANRLDFYEPWGFQPDMEQDKCK